MTTNAIPAPTLPPRIRPASSIAQTAGLSHGLDPEPERRPETTPVEQTQPPVPAEQPQPIGAASDETPSAPPTRTVSTTTGGRRRRNQPESAPKTAGVKKPILLNIDEDLKQRMVNTVGWTGPRTGLRNQQAFIRRAIGDLCERLERDHNSGAPFPLVVDAAED